VVRRVRVLSGGVGLNVLDWRSEDEAQIPLLCIHGITANAHAFDGIAQMLLPEIGVIAPDLRGRGESDAPAEGYGVVAHTRDMLAVLDALMLERVDVVGWSLGARITMQLAATAPARVRRLILLDPLLTTLTDETRRTLDQIQGRLAATYPDWTCALAAARDIAAYGPWNAALESYVRADLVELPDGRVGHRVSADVARLEWSIMPPALSKVLPVITAPTLLLRATDPMLRPSDQLLPRSDAERAVRFLKHGSTEDVAGANHYTIALGEPHGTVAAIRRFLLTEPGHALAG
jgi:pimeloyl-ACP methyl ester carboxylesterase